MGIVIRLPVPPPPERWAAIWAAADVLYAEREAEREAEEREIRTRRADLPPRLRVVR
jgi:hypothetical protein